MYRIALILAAFLFIDGIVLFIIPFDSYNKLSIGMISLDCNAARLKSGDNDKTVDDFRQQMRGVIDSGRKGYEDISLTAAYSACAGILIGIITGIVFFAMRRKVPPSEDKDILPAS